MDGEIKESTIWWQMADTALAAGLPFLSTDTAAKILSAVLRYGGGNEQMVFSAHFRADLHYIQERWGVKGGESPDPDMVEAVKEYRAQMVSDDPPTWLKELFKERYNVKLYTYG